MIKDSFGRIHNYLRISLTDNCNMRCFYCMPEEDYDFTPASKLMRAHEIATLARIFAEEGVNKIRLTGGEPLVRKDAAGILLALSEVPVKLTLTTNGARLDEFLPVLEEARIRSLNVSLDTLQADKFQVMTRRNLFDRIFGNIRLLIDRGFHVKVNMVVMKGLNDNEIPDFVEWTRNTPVHVRFIEFMPFAGNRWTSNKVVSLDEILFSIALKYNYIRLADEKNGTAKAFAVPGHTGTFAVISTMTAPFCSTCNRMRLTADGKLKNCLFSRTETDLLSALRRGEDVRPLIHQSILAKARELGGQFNADIEHLHAESIDNRSMIAIGG